MRVAYRWSTPLTFTFSALTALLAGCDTGPVWKDLSLPAESVRVQMPGNWKEQPLESGNGRMYQTMRSGTEYLLGIRILSQLNLPPDETQGMLRSVQTAMIGALDGGTLTSEKFTELEGRPGLEFDAKGSSGETMQVRLYITDRNLVSVMVHNPRPPKSPEQIEKFLNSLTFDLDPAPQPSDTATVSPATGNKLGAPSHPSKKPDHRTAWRYENAPRIFPDQLGFNGVIRKEGDRWIDYADGGTNDFVEVERNEQYVELKRPVGDFRLRLYDDHSEYKFGYNPSWQQMYPGKWE
jgi:hypothetical protein